MATSASATSTSRVIALVDMDCFYVQVEERDNPSIIGVPAAVVQYKAFKGGALIAVNYEARARGVTRHIRGDDAKAVCPEIQLVRVPESRGKADLTKYRDAGREVINVLTEFSSCVERASIDEAYIDLTEAVELRLAELSSQDALGTSFLRSLKMEYLETNFIYGCGTTEEWLDDLKESEIPPMDDIRLAIGAEIVGRMRDAVYKKTKFRCSAGIAHNKVVAKLVCGINKPNKQTVLPHCSVQKLWSSTKIDKVRGLGGKLGDVLTERLGCVHVCDLGKFTESKLNAELGPKTGSWLYQLFLGYDDEPVTPRQLPKSIGCNKNFYGKEALKTKERVKFWINQLASEVVERIQRDLETNNRRAKSMTLHVKFEDQNALSRACGVHPQYNLDRIAADAYSVMEKLYQTVGLLPVNSLGLIASKFEDEIDTSSYAKINDYFSSKPLVACSSDELNSDAIRNNGSNSSSSRSSTSSSAEKCTGETSSVSSSVNSGDSQHHTKSQGALSKKNNQVPVPPQNETPSNNPHPSNEDTRHSIRSFFSTSGAKPQSSANLETTPKKCDPSLQSNGVHLNQPTSKPFFTFSETVPLISPRKSPRKLAATASTSGKGSLEESGFVQPSKQQTSTSATDKECERCGKRLSIREYPSHMDYHYAKDVSREINGLPPLDFDLRPETLRKKEVAEAAERAARASQKRPRGRGRGGSTAGTKRGRGSKSGAASTSATQTQSRTIDSFFASNSRT